MADERDLRKTLGIIPEKKPFSPSSDMIFIELAIISLYSKGRSCILVLIISNGCVSNVADNPPKTPDIIFTSKGALLVSDQSSTKEIINQILPAKANLKFS